MFGKHSFTLRTNEENFENSNLKTYYMLCTIIEWIQVSHYLIPRFIINLGPEMVKIGL